MATAGKVMAASPGGPSLYSDRRTTEFAAMVPSRVGKVMAKSDDEIAKIHDEIAGVRMKSRRR